MDTTYATYREVQQFRQKWLWIPLVCSTVATVGVIGYLLVRQLALGRPVGNPPMPDKVLASIGIAVILCEALTLALLRAIALITEVRTDALYLRFYPAGWKRIAFDDIRRCQARTYDPLMEYGGWGVRWGRSGKAYNISGNRGVQLELANGQKLLIGSEKAEDLEEAIRQWVRTDV